MTDKRHAQLEMRWVPVTDAAGRTRMEAVWITPTASAAISHAA
ncbi:hypothetical protein [Nocardioides plantarum]|uniref:Uncharacterized protein n=1 Tax=Nocardioides plantarum TaxID=29299 RepID=A0ABV5KG18_9ACTN|nr:hypothetical protein [Nocardioides plantarum]